MKLIVGLGNPGEKYENTRHNLGFQVLDKLSSFNFSDWEKDSRFNALISKGETRNKKVILVKPKTYVNLSGVCVTEMVRYFNLPLSNLWVVCDDISLPVGKIRIRKEGSSGGHKGLQSIIDFLKNDKFPRFRIGIKKGEGRINVEKFVLQKMTRKEKEEFEKIIEKVIEAIKYALEKNLDKAMEKYN